MSASRHPGHPEPVDSPFVQLSGITKDYGTTRANGQVDLQVGAGEILGLVGGNGAGKSTLMKVLTGVVTPDEGRLSIEARQVPFAAYDANVARARGIRIVHQELSLCDNLTVAENFFVESPRAVALTLAWKAGHAAAARDALDAIFPGHGIPVERPVETLSISQRQMVEIARAAFAPGARLVVLDEPTSSLDQNRSAQFRRFVQGRAAAGMAFILISHKLQEVVDTCSRIEIMRNGRNVAALSREKPTVAELIAAMGGVAEDRSLARRAARQASAAARRTSGAVHTAFAGADRIDLHGGEIVGLAGLEGAGQRDFLLSHFARCRGSGNDVAYVSGDRQKEGIFALWDVLSNITIGRFVQQANLRLVTAGSDRDQALATTRALKLDPQRLASPIVDLSGGNQQKALVARALAGDAATVLFDDPTRGVDVAAKDDFYAAITEVARSGKLVIWYSTEDLEFQECDRVLVFRDGRVAKALAGDEITLDAIIASSFSAAPATEKPPRVERLSSPGLPALLAGAAPYLGLLLTMAVLALLNPASASFIGVDLLLTPAVVLVFVAIAQLFVVGGSEIDLSIGAFTGFINVLTAMFLVEHPVLTAAAVAASVLCYAFFGTLIQTHRIPSIVLTLGTSFIWAGISYTLQPVPGGSSPPWLTSLLAWHLGPLPGSIAFVLVAAGLAAAIDRSPVGVALRGFGGNAGAMTRTGWSAPAYSFIRYSIASSFAVCAGLALTGINGASDVNASSSLTLVSVAAVVIGGSALVGGLISAPGAVAGALILSLTGALLAALGIDTDFNAAVQGLLLVAMLCVQTFLMPRKRGG